ncbi:unnamed protein product [Timema podura]|uniref:Timeless C-terminal domain-containing protein n=1 Tax=Timema podura TaxID=61482 RepID=A0ABN7NWQ4_TIMPD|nr:unnamed protein product [Timema podura]
MFKARFSKEDSDNLCWHYCQSVKSEDKVGRIIELYAENGVTNKTTTGVHDCMQNISCTDGLSDAELTDNVPNKIHLLLDNLRKAGKGHLIVWLQKVLIEVCYVKLRCSRTVLLSNDDAVIEPIPWVYTAGCKHLLLQSSLDKPILRYLQCSAPAQRVKEGTYKNIIKVATALPLPLDRIADEWKLLGLKRLNLMGQSIPLVTWNAEQKSAMKNKTFSLLLYTLGFQLSTDSGKIFARIPNFWTPDFMFSMAEKLGPIDSSALKFDVNVLKKSDRAPGIADTCLLETTKTRDPTIFAMPRNKQTSPAIRFTPMPNSTPNWLNLVSQFKSAAVSMPPPTSSHHDY